MYLGALPIRGQGSRMGKPKFTQLPQRIEIFDTWDKRSYSLTPKPHHNSVVDNTHFFTRTDRPSFANLSLFPFLGKCPSNFPLSLELVPRKTDRMLDWLGMKVCSQEENAKTRLGANVEGWQMASSSRGK